MSNSLYLKKCRELEKPYSTARNKLHHVLESVRKTVGYLESNSVDFELQSGSLLTFLHTENLRLIEILNSYGIDPETGEKNGCGGMIVEN